MEYTKYTTELDNEIILRVNDDGTHDYIPTDPSNSDYQAYLRWVENPEAEEFAPRLAE